MLTPEYYEKLSDDLIKLYADLEDAVIGDMVRRMLKMGRVSEMTEWQMIQLQESGMLYEDVLAEIARRTDATQNQVRAIFEDAGVKAIQNDNVRYHNAALQGIIKLSPAALQTLNAGYEKCLGDLSNLTLTTANTSQQAYITACNNAYMQITSGTFDYDTAIMNAVKAIANEGTHVFYPTGHSDMIDVAVRRSVLTGVGQTVRKLSEIDANEMGCDIMELTAHAGARPDHAAWQGKLVSLSGKNAGKIIEGCRVLSLAEIGYGTGAGFGGWNCRHDWYPFYVGISKRAYSDKRLAELNEKNIEYNGKKYTEYEISQMQRSMERSIRKTKRRIIAADTGRQNADSDELKQAFDNEFTKQSLKLKAKEEKLNDFLQKTGTLPDNARTQVVGFGRSVAQKAVWAKKKYDPNTIVKKRQSKVTKNFVEFNNGQKDLIKFKNIEKDLRKSPIGREIIDYLSNNPVPIYIYYNVDVPDDLLGEYDSIDDVVKIYASNTKTIEQTSETIIHELTHRRYDIGGDLWSECVCRAQEYKHRMRKNDLTISEKRAIIKEIRDSYNIDGTWKWREKYE